VLDGDSLDGDSPGRDADVAGAVAEATEGIAAPPAGAGASADADIETGTLKRERAMVHVTPELTAIRTVAATANQRTLTPVRRAGCGATTLSRREASGITGAARRASMPLQRSRDGVRAGSDLADSTISSRSATSVAQASHDS
jgi:hypothetical protein